MTTAQDEEHEDKKGGEKRSPGGSVLEFFLIVAVALGLALGIQAFLVKPFRIPSESMVPTLDVGERVLVDRLTKNFGDYDRGDILVFKPPAGSDATTCGVQHSNRSPCPRPTEERSDTNFIKRVVAVGGDRLSVRGGRVYINGRPQREPYARLDDSCEICNLPEAIRIPEGHLFMMGDNRGASADSREWGPVPEDWVIGQAFATYWPPKKIGTL
jgi:signal peptidase I